MWTLLQLPQTLTVTHVLLHTVHNIMQPFCLNCWFSQFYRIHTFIEKVTPSRSNFALAMHLRGRVLAAVRYACQRINLFSSEKKIYAAYTAVLLAPSHFSSFFLSLSEIPVGIFSHSIQLSLSLKSLFCSCMRFSLAPWLTKQHGGKQQRRICTFTHRFAPVNGFFPKGHNEHGDDFYWIIMCCVLVTVDWAHFKI